MKKQTIWILTVLMAFTFIGLLCIQIFYMKNIVGIRYDQFSQGVRQSLIAVTQKLEQDEISYFLEDRVSRVESQSIYAQRNGSSLPSQEGVKLSFSTPTGLQADLTIKGDASEIIKIQSGNLVGQHYQKMRDVYRDHFLYQRGVLDEVILNIIASASERPISERADSAVISSYLRQQLDTLGIDVPFEFAVMSSSGAIQYRSAGFRSDYKHERIFTQTLFPRDLSQHNYKLEVYFPTMKDYIFKTISFMVPAFAFTLILLIIFVFTVIVAFRQKKLTEMKNDFINNMTHEFKTPISGISLAGQMLNDPDIRKSPAMLQQISQVINDETKRLRFQVEKVLQMSLFDRQKATLKIEEIDANLVVYNIVNTFKLKVEKYGGHISANLDAMNALVDVDEMHFTNVIFNLLDNAVKYRSEERPLHLTVGSRDLDGDRLEISISDNGIGIKRDDVKKIFEKFYRVSTGNRHDVKGFGLGLAYVKKMVTELGGSIVCESELNIGTKFIIVLPLSKN